jgi:hypothetical protein
LKEDHGCGAPKTICGFILVTSQLFGQLLGVLDKSCPETARDAAEIANGGELSEAEWASYANRWERVWYAVVLSDKEANP